MDVGHLTCTACQARWPLTCRIEFYEQQSLESAPCPRCNNLSLRCTAKSQRRRALPKGVAMWNMKGGSQF